jgi:hypothetical protein
MDKDYDGELGLIDLGSASAETRGAVKDDSDSIGGRLHQQGIADD